jgi:hypothetical protein
LGAATGEVVTAEVGNAFGERGGGQKVSETADAGMIEPSLGEPDLDGVVLEG